MADVCLKNVYQRPATRFVAGFIGSPAMNFFTGRLNSDGRSIELPGQVQLPVNGEDFSSYQDKKVILGIRPEHFEIVEEGQGAINLTVDHLELLGADTLVHLIFTLWAALFELRPNTSGEPEASICCVAKGSK